QAQAPGAGGIFNPPDGNSVGFRRSELGKLPDFVFRPLGNLEYLEKLVKAPGQRLPDAVGTVESDGFYE
ncbi:MAG TPA: hypothetical protein VE131_05975, partial [Terriglobales bacterium]|nr:hypothetical protein [Terriglobales bacterium]